MEFLILILYYTVLERHRVQRSEVRAERLVFLAKDNRHKLLPTCVTRVTYIFTQVKLLWALRITRDREIQRMEREESRSNWILTKVALENLLIK